MGGKQQKGSLNTRSGWQVTGRQTEPLASHTSSEPTPLSAGSRPRPAGALLAPRPRVLDTRHSPPGYFLLCGSGVWHRGRLFSLLSTCFWVERAKKQQQTRRAGQGYRGVKGPRSGVWGFAGLPLGTPHSSDKWRTTQHALDS